MMHQITLTIADDWEGLFIDGELVDEGRGGPLEDALEVLAKIYGFQFASREVDRDWMEEEGRLPDNLADVKFA